MKKQIKPKRIRVTKLDIAKAREELYSLAEKVDTVKVDSRPAQPTGKWHGLIYCSPEGLAWIADTRLQNICLGKAEEISLILRKRKVDTENVLQVLQAIKEFRAEKKTQSYHLHSGNNGSGITTGLQKSYRINFKKNPQFINLLDGLIKKGYGIPTIQRELKTKGYNVPYATLGRWIAKRKAKQM